MEARLVALVQRQDVRCSVRLLCGVVAEVEVRTRPTKRARTPRRSPRHGDQARRCYRDGSVPRITASAGRLPGSSVPWPNSLAIQAGSIVSDLQLQGLTLLRIRLVRSRAVDVRATATTVEVFHRARRVSSHAREHARQRFLTGSEHMAASHRPPGMDTVEADGLGTQRWSGGWRAGGVDPRLNTRPHPEHGHRACIGLKRLFKRYGPERLTAACQRALATGGISYTSVDAI